MSLILRETAPCTSVDNYSSKSIYIRQPKRDIEISMFDFCKMVEYVLTNTNFDNSDPRYNLIKKIQQGNFKDGFGGVSKRFVVDPCEHLSAEPVKEMKETNGTSSLMKTFEDVQACLIAVISLCKMKELFTEKQFSEAREYAKQGLKLGQKLKKLNFTLEEGNGSRCGMGSDTK